MTRDVVCCPMDLSVKDAAAIMQDEGIRRLLVLNADHCVVVLLSLDDLATQLPTRQLAGETLAKIAAGHGVGAVAP